MDQRTHTGTTRALPSWSLLALIALAAAAVLLAACGASDGGTSPTTAASVTETSTPSASPSPTASPSPSTTLSLYFMRGEELGVAERREAQTTAPAAAAMEALLAGPTGAESAAGLTSAVPGGTRLLGLTIDGSTARVDLSEQFAAGGGSLSMRARVAQVVYTLTQFRTVKAVTIMLEGSVADTLGGEGLLLGDDQHRADWRDFEPAIFVEHPGVGAVLESPFELSGTASVFEGAFMARLVGGDRTLTEVPVQASRGAPGRGAFREAIPFETAASSGAVVVFDQSMEDGSRLHEVRVPVTFSSD